jgi:Na+/proline symporter
LHISIFSNWNIPFWATVVITILLIWLYTFRGGIRTIIWTDTLQTLFLLLAVIVTVVMIGREMGLGFGAMAREIGQSDYYRIFFFSDWKAGDHFVKQFLSGAFIAIVMTGLDQDMMQKNLSCRNLRDAKKNMAWMSCALVPVNFLFLSLGALLFIFAARHAIPIPEQSDDLFPIIATRGYLSPAVTIIFMIGLVAAAYSSADSALTSLTTSFTVDICNGSRLPEKRLQRLRKLVHIGLSIVLLAVILLFKLINDQNVISAIFTAAGYTYGPLLGFYSFGLFTKYRVRDKWVPAIAIASPIVTYFISSHSESWFQGYQFGFELLILNGLLTFLGLLMIRKR